MKYTNTALVLNPQINTWQVTQCVAKTILVSSSQLSPGGAGSAGTPGYKEDVSAEQALQRAEMISEHLPPPPCFKPQVGACSMC